MGVLNLGSILPVGTIIHSMLSTTQFASEYGDNWVLADGRSVTGTRYAAVTGNSTIPDMRSTFLRGKDNSRGLNPDGDLALGTFTSDKLGSHSHGLAKNLGAAGSSGIIPSFTSSGTRSTEDVSSNAGSNETAPKSIIVNIFIRIN